jgi:hypothetical protein
VCSIDFDMIILACCDDFDREPHGCLIESLPKNIVYYKSGQN